MSSESRTVTAHNAAEVARWCGGRLVEEIDPFDESTSPGINLRCDGLNGEIKRASVGHMVIRRHDGTFDVFNPFE